MFAAEYLVLRDEDCEVSEVLKKLNPRAIIVVACLVLALGSRAASAASPSCLPDVPLVDDHGQPFNPTSLKGKAVLVDFVHVSCPGVCMTLTAKFTEVAKKLGPEVGSNVMLLSITNDPEHDSPAQLLSMARKRGADQNGWLFATGKPDDVTEMLEAFDLKNGREPDGDPAHIPQVFLVGTDGCVVRDYNGLVMHPPTVAGDLQQAASGKLAKAHSKWYEHL
jgi:cytochrome oxidase Cu insertion factor (SCO1/SenC/PrrC family)